MRRSGFLLFCLFLILSVVCPLAVMADEVTENLVSQVLESFDPETRTTEWMVTGSKFAREGYPKQAYAKAWPEALFGYNREEKDYQVLGVNGQFNRQGYNYIEIIPVKEDGEGGMVHNPIPIPGRVKQLDAWIWGSEYDFYVEVHLRDYSGINWVLELGNLSYTGWKNLRIDIPSYIPQAARHIPYYKQMTFEKFVIWTRPNEKVDDFFVYVDQLKVLTDKFESRFDGDTLTWPEKISETWGETE